jgi:hypothetical protein
MNDEIQIAELALENLQNATGITGRWEATARKELDGILMLKLNNKTIKFNAEVKRGFRGHHLAQIKEKAKQFDPLIVIAEYILPKLKQELREEGIAYLETNGNVFIKEKENFVWVDIQKTAPPQVEKNNRAFTKTGLKVMFYYLVNEQLLNLPYREIAKLTGTALGNINYVITGLKEQTFLLKLDQHTYKLQNKKALIDKWAAAFEIKLKPALEIGTFKFLKAEHFNTWQDIPLKKDKTRWGGEPGGDLLTHYLKPAELTLYTIETRNELIKNYQLIPDPNGNIKVYQKFWKDEDLNTNFKGTTESIVPPLLIYADLINTGDKRCLETAEKVYEQYLQD